MTTRNHNGKEPIAYYLALYKIKGHTTCRADLKKGKADFDRFYPKDAPKVTKKEVYRIDRINGVIDLAE